jgi:thymidylate kinase
VPRELIEPADQGRLPRPGPPTARSIFDVPYEFAAKRLASSARKLDRFEREERAFFDRVREYLSRHRQGRAEARSPHRRLPTIRR